LVSVCELIIMLFSSLVVGIASLAGSALPLQLEDGSLRLAPAGAAVGSGATLLKGVDRSLRASGSPSGGVFLHSDFRDACSAADVALGSLCCRRVLACARCTRYWMAPAVGGCAADVPLDTQFLLVELGDGDDDAEPQSYALLLPLVDRTARSSVGGASARLPRPLRNLLARLRPRGWARALNLHVSTDQAAGQL